MFKEGDRVVLVSPNPYFGFGLAKTGDVGVVRGEAGVVRGEAGGNVRGKKAYYINFPRHPTWKGLEDELELEPEEIKWEV